jgi:hypothetical protein
MSKVSPKQRHASLATRRSTAGAMVWSIFVLTIGVSVFAGAKLSAEPATPSPPATQTIPDLPKVYLPGLGEFMQVIQMHHAKLWLAAKARNWPLAEYQLSEMKEVLDEVREMVPTYKNVPVGQMVDAIATGPIGDLEKAVEEKKFDKFAANYDKLTEACNSCHMAASRGFIKIRRPARSTFENQDFRPARR